MASTIWQRFFVSNFKGEPSEVQARESIIAHVMNQENVSKDQAINIVFDTGYETWAEGAGGEVKELWGLAKLEVAARNAMMRHKRISDAVQAVGEEAILEEAVRMGMDEEEVINLIDRGVDIIERGGGQSKSRKMQQWLDDFLGANGPVSIDRVKTAAVDSGIVSDQILERERDWNLMCTVASQYNFRGSERGVWAKEST